jgi:hypothetical protein
MYNIRSNLLPITIAITTVVMPICAVIVFSGWLEFYDWWFVFVWGYNIILTLDFRLLGSADFGVISPISPLNVLVLSISWIIIGGVLITTYYLEKKNSIQMRWCLITALVGLILQVILPINLFNFGSALFANGSLIPLPIPSTIAVVGYISFLFQNNTKNRTSHRIIEGHRSPE